MFAFFVITVSGVRAHLQNTAGSNRIAALSNDESKAGTAGAGAVETDLSARTDVSFITAGALEHSADIAVSGTFLEQKKSGKVSRGKKRSALSTALDAISNPREQAKDTLSSELTIADKSTSHSAMLQLLRSCPVIEKLEYPAELQHLIMQVKLKEAQFLGPRLHSTITERNRDFLLEEDILGYGFINKCSLEDFMLTFLQVLCCCRGTLEGSSKDNATESDLSSDKASILEKATEDQDNPFSSPNIFHYGEQEGENPEHLSKTWFVRNYHTFLRRLLFNNPYIAYLSHRETSAENWSDWERLFIEGNAGNNFKDINKEDLRHLKQDRFEVFAQKVALLQTCTLQRNELNRAWYNYFLFPYGPAFFCAELDKDLTPSTNYLSYVALTMFSFIERAGRLKSMLDLGGGIESSAAALQKLVGNSLKIRFCNKKNPLNKLARRLEGPHGYQEEVALEYIHRTDLNWHDGSNFILKRHDKFSNDFRNLCIQEANKRVLRYLRSSQDDALASNEAAFSESFEPETHESSVNSNVRQNFRLTSTPYCPIREHRIFLQLLEDFGRLVKMDINNQELFLSLGQIALLNMMVYGLEQSRGALSVAKGRADHSDINIIPLLNLSSRNSGIRNSSLERCAANNKLNKVMLLPYIQAHLQNLVELVDPELLQTSALSAEQVNELFHLVSALFTCNMNGQDFLLNASYLMVTGQWTPANVSKLSRYQRKNLPFATKKASDFAMLHLDYQTLSSAICKSMLRQQRHNDNYHNAFGKSIGLISSRLTRGHCYCLSDELLRTLVMTVVGCSDHMLFGQFLECLEQRYHVIIGPKEARKYYGQNRDAQYRSYKLPLSNLEDEFTKNEQGLKAQLSRLGLLHSLSDACDFVHNPFYQG